MNQLAEEIEQAWKAKPKRERLKAICDFYGVHVTYEEIDEALRLEGASMADSQE